MPVVATTAPASFREMVRYSALIAGGGGGGPTGQRPPRTERSYDYLRRRPPVRTAAEASAGQTATQRTNNVKMNKNPVNTRTSFSTGRRRLRIWPS